MIFTNETKADSYEVLNWLEKSIELTPYQKSKLRSDETIRFSPFTFYKKKQKGKVNPLWRLTILIYPIYYLVLLMGMPIKMILTGNWYYSRGFIDNFHNVWLQKLKL